MRLWPRRPLPLRLTALCYDLYGARSGPAVITHGDVLRVRDAEGQPFFEIAVRRLPGGDELEVRQLGPTVHMDDKLLEWAAAEHERRAALAEAAAE